MNLFWLDEDPRVAVRWLTDAHVGSTIRESEQMLATALRGHFGRKERELETWNQGVRTVKNPLIEEIAAGVQLIALETHALHPMTSWVASTWGNMKICLVWCKAACEEHQFRFGTKYVTENRLITYAELIQRYSKKSGDVIPWGFSEPPICVPDEFNTGSLIPSYKAYYRAKKADMSRYTGRAKPLWLR